VGARDFLVPVFATFDGVVALPVGQSAGDGDGDGDGDTTAQAFGGYLNTSVDITPTGVPVLVNPTVQSATFDPATYVWAPSTDVEIQRDGKYAVTYGAVYNNTGNGTRFVQLDLLVNGLAHPGLEVTTSVEGSGFTPVNGITRTAILDLVGGDSIGIAATRLNGAATLVTVTNEVFLSIQKVR